MKTVPQMVMAGLNRAPVGAPAEHAATCCFCGTKIRVGDLASEAEFTGEGFMDGRLLQPHGDKFVLCGCCADLRSRPAFNSVQHILVSNDGVFQIASKAAKAWFVLNPPTPPFAVMQSTTKSAHLPWKAPLSRSQDHWYVQLGARTVLLRRHVALAAWKASERVMKALSEKSKSKKVQKSPFVSLDPLVTELSSGVLRPDVVRFCKEHGFTRELALLESVGPGELWALFALIYGAEEAKEPARFDLSAAIEVRKAKKQAAAAAA